MNSVSPSSKKQRVLVVENHQFFRENLVNWIGRQEQLECCGEAESVSDAQSAVDKQRPDLLLLDLSLRGSTGFDLLSWLKSRELKLPVIVLSQYEEAFSCRREIRIDCSQSPLFGLRKKSDRVTLQEA